MNGYENQLSACDRMWAEIEAYRPLTPHSVKQLQRYYRIGFTYTTNAIEGNTLTESETKVLLEDGLTVSGKPMKDHLEAVGQAKAYDHLYELLGQPYLKESDLLALHGLVVQGVDAAEPGQYRSKPVLITGTSYLPPSPAEVPKQMKHLLAEQLPQWQQTEHPVHLAALAHLSLVTIHPFLDGNGRTARLLMNLLLLKASYSITLIPPVLRSEYIAAIRQFQEEQECTSFLNFISTMVYESSKELLRLLKHLK